MHSRSGKKNGNTLSRVRMNWKIHPPWQLAPLGPRDCLRGRIFQNTPPIGSALLQCLAKILKFRGLLGPCDLKRVFQNDYSITWGVRPNDYNNTWGGSIGTTKSDYVREAVIYVLAEFVR